MANPLAVSLPTMSGVDIALLFIRTLPQLLGEEVLTMLPFLAILYALHSRGGLSRKGAIIGAWLISAAIFGAAHLPTYDWNVVQCFVVIGTARLMLTLPYIKTKNIWVSAGAHVFTDWTIFGVTLASAG